MYGPFADASTGQSYGIKQRANSTWRTPSRAQYHKPATESKPENSSFPRKRLTGAVLCAAYKSRPWSTVFVGRHRVPVIGSIKAFRRTPNLATLSLVGGNLRHFEQCSSAKPQRLLTGESADAAGTAALKRSQESAARSQNKALATVGARARTSGSAFDSCDWGQAFAGTHISIRTPLGAAVRNGIPDIGHSCSGRINADSG